MLSVFMFLGDDDSQNNIPCKGYFAIVAALQVNARNVFNPLKRHNKMQYDETINVMITTLQDNQHDMNLI